jgi:hypothetical protein
LAQHNIVLEDFRSDDNRILEKAMARIGKCLDEDDEAKLAEKQKAFPRRRCAATGGAP